MEGRVVARAEREGLGEAAVRIFKLNVDGEEKVLGQWLAEHSSERWMLGQLLLVREWTVLATAIRLPELKLRAVGAGPTQTPLEPVEGEPAEADSFQHNAERAKAVLRLFLARLPENQGPVKAVRPGIAAGIEAMPDQLTPLIETLAVAWREAKIQFQLGS